MPLYDFHCQTCGDFEAWRTLADLEIPVTCPTCDEPARRVFSAPNINLNTSGLSLRRAEAKDPKLVKRDAEPKAPRNQAAHGRPWMISHEQ